MSLALGQKRSPDNIRKQERDIMHGASKHSQAIYHTFPVSVIQRKPSCPCGGGCPRCKNTLTIQPKLKINEPGDTHEQEADRVAEQVMRMPANTSASGQLSGVRKEDKHIQNRIADLVMATTAQTVVSGASSRIQRFVRQSTGQTDAAPASVNQALASPGRPLEPMLRQDMEQRFGSDFSRVRVHTGAVAEQSARDVNAHAYTVGNSIVFGAGRFASGTHEGRRLIAHELTHVRQQSIGQTTKEVVQRSPDEDDWSSVEAALVSFARPGDGPRLVFWARHNRKPPANAGEIAAIVSDFYKAMEANREKVLEEYDQAQLKKDRSELEKRRKAARAAEDLAAETKPVLGQKQREQERVQNRRRLYTAIQKAWEERRRYADAELLNQAKSLVAHRISLPKALRHGLHWKSDQQRWVFIYYYYRESIKVRPESFENPSADDTELLQYAVLAEEDYLETSAKEAEASELARYREGIPRAARTRQIKKLAATRPMNPLEDFEPGIHDYAPYQGQPQSVDVDIVGLDHDAENVIVKYSGGKVLHIPLNRGLFFYNKPLDPTKVLRIFTRRHKKTQRLIPFVIYENTLGIDLDVLSEEELALLGLPRFDPVLTPVIIQVFSPEFGMQKLSVANLKLASLHAGGLGLRQLGVPLASGAVGTGYTLITGTVRTGSALTTAAARQVSATVNAYGYSWAAASHLGKTAYTYYLSNAIRINTASLMVTDIALTLAGQDTGPISPGDQVSMVVADVKAGAKTARDYWKLLEGEVQEVNLTSKQAIVHITKLRDIAEKTAKVEYDLGKKLVWHRQLEGTSKAAQGMEEAAIKTGKLAAYTLEHGGHAWPILKDGRILRCSRWCTPSSVEEAFGELIKSHPHLTDEMTKLKKLKGKAAAESATKLGNRLDQIRKGEEMPLDDLKKLLGKPGYAKGTQTGNDLHFVLYRREGGKLGFKEWKRMVTKRDLPPAKLSEHDAGMVVKNKFPSPDWEYHPLYLQGQPAKKTGGKNPLGSSEPEWYSKALNAAVEVKRKDFIARLDSVDWNAITRQLEQRIHAMPPGTKNWIVFDIRGQPVSLAEVSIFPKLSPKWNEILFLTDRGPLKIVGGKAIPFP
ncbi:conserved hypothetical protein [Candidatus Jettenia caeni]|uniref:eCIS core domain-containing protein n=1 Tax=Candidatus Jettenia caeni TaxID=247490 RepID=I3IJH6_9BACT|nr:conserved hypothetical protein [Candidatus Jettenia caeni]